MPDPDVTTATRPLREPSGTGAPTEEWMWPR